MTWRYLSQLLVENGKSHIAHDTNWKEKLMFKCNWDRFSGFDWWCGSTGTDVSWCRCSAVPGPSVWWSWWWKWHWGWTMWGETHVLVRGGYSHRPQFSHRFHCWLPHIYIHTTDPNTTNIHHGKICVADQKTSQPAWRSCLDLLWMNWSTCQSFICMSGELYELLTALFRTASSVGRGCGLS